MDSAYLWSKQRPMDFGMILLLSLRQISEEHSHQIGKKNVIICSIAVATTYIHTYMHANYDLIRILFILLLFLFTCSSNDGTDHGWGGHYMILGGRVAIVDLHAAMLALV